MASAWAKKVALETLGAAAAKEELEWLEALLDLACEGSIIEARKIAKAKMVKQSIELHGKADNN